MKIDASSLAAEEGRQVVSMGVSLTRVDAYATRAAEAPFAWHRLLPIESPAAGIAPSAYELPQTPEAPTWLLFRVEADRAFHFVPRLMSTSTYDHVRTASTLRTGTYYGVMIGAIVYNVFLALWMKDRAYFLYILFETAFCLTVAEWDRTVAALWPSFMPALPEGLNERLMGLTGIIALLFARDFLDLRTSRRVSIAVRAQVAAGCMLLLIPLDWVRPYLTAMGNIFIIFAALHVSFMALLSWRRGNANAPLFVLGWGTMLFVIIGAALMNLGAMVPRFGYIDMIRLGSATEAMVLAAALARRMSSMKRAEAKARAALAAARDQQLASLSTLVGGVAHEIGNPLNFAAGGAEDVVGRLHLAASLAEGLAADWNADRVGELCVVLGTARKSAALAARGTERIGGIVKNLRAYVGAGAQQNEITDLSECIRSTIALLDAHLHTKRVEVELDLQGEVSIRCRPGEMNQVITNLVLNACQAMPDGGKIVIASEAKDDALDIVVSDSGHGVPPELRQAIFDPFFTTRAPNEGTGLGLAVSREIVRRHGGTLDLVSARDGDGAAFAIRLPLS